jgi:hypothetical protein
MTPRRSAPGSYRKTSRDEVLGTVAQKALLKNLICLLSVQDHKDDGSEDLLARSQVHANDQAGVLAVATQQ